MSDMGLQKRKISVYYEEVVPSQTNAYSTMRFRIGQEFDVEVPNNPIGELLLTKEFDIASQTVKQAVKYQISRLNDPSMVAVDKINVKGVYQKMDAMQPQEHSGTAGVIGGAPNTSNEVGADPEVLRLLKELKEVVADGTVIK